MGVLNLLQWSSLLSLPLVLLGVYIYWNDRKITAIPTSALYFGPKRVTLNDARKLEAKLASSQALPSKEVLPSRTGRRYIVVGGGGFLGSWIATKLLERGEEHHRIRILDLNPPAGNHTMKDALSKGVQFIKVDVTDAMALEAAFKAPWPSSNVREVQPELTVFHTAANIRFYERHAEFLSRSTRVNVAGTANVIAASRVVGATVLVYTSSGSVGIHNTRFLLWPWEKEPKNFVQVINDDDGRLPKRYEDFFSNYAASKLEAEALVRGADKSPTGSTTTAGGERRDGVLRTGCIRPGNGIFGPRGDMLCGAYLVRKNNPSWISSVVQSFTYVENCAEAHLCYEARLIEHQGAASGTKHITSARPDIGGQAFCIADPGPTPTYGDVYTILETLTDGETHFPSFSPTFMLLLAHSIEWYYRTYHSLLSKGWSWVKLFPPITGDIINLQPALFYLTSVHLIFDDSRARMSPEKGGLGYTGAWTTIEGLVRTVEEHKSGIGRSEVRSEKAGVSFEFGFRFGGGKGRKSSKTGGTKIHMQVPDGLKVTDAIPVVAPPVEVI